MMAFLYPYQSHGLTVSVDATGIGYHMGTALKRAGFKVKLIQVQGAPTPGRMAGEDMDNRDRFLNAKAQYYWNVRLRFKNGQVSWLTDELTASQLQAIFTNACGGPPRANRIAHQSASGAIESATAATCARPSGFFARPSSRASRNAAATGSQTTTAK